MRGLGLSGFLLLVSLLVLAPNLPVGRVPGEDAGVFFYVAERILEGGIPYRDVWDHKPPAVYVVNAIGLALAGPVGVWVVQLVALFGAAMLGYRALAEAFGLRPAIVGSLAWLMAAPRLFLEDGHQSSYAEFYGLPLQFGALLLFSREPPSGRPGWRVAALGALGGLAFLLKPTLAGTWVAIALVALVSRRRAGIRFVAVLVLPALAIVASALAVFAARGALGELVDQVFVYNGAYASFATPLERAEAIATGFRLTVPSGLALLAVAAWTRAASARRPVPPLLAAALVAFPLEIVLSALGRGYFYYFLAWLPSMAVLAAYLGREVEVRFAGPRALAILTVIVLAMSVRPAMLVARLAAETDDGSSRVAAAYVAEHSGPGDSVLVWGSRTEVLVLADRRAPTRYVYHYAPLETRGYATAARVDELLSDLQRRRPVLILDASRDSFITPPLDPAGFRSWTSPDPQYAPLPEIARLIDFVTNEYDRVATLPQTGWPVWRLRGG